MFSNREKDLVVDLDDAAHCCGCVVEVGKATAATTPALAISSREAIARAARTKTYALHLYLDTDHLRHVS